MGLTAAGWTIYSTTETTTLVQVLMRAYAVCRYFVFASVVDGITVYLGYFCVHFLLIIGMNDKNVHYWTDP